MNKILIGVAAIALLATGCAENELMDAPNATPNDGKIRFSGTTGLVKGRAADGNPFNTTADLQNLKTFHVTGYVDGDNVPLVNSDVNFNNGVSWEYANEPYWPNAAMDFFAYANWATAPTVTKDGITATDVTIGADALGANGQKDLLVSATLGATKEVRTLLSFKHALTQVVFKSGNVNPDKIDVNISGVKIVNVGSKGNMNFLKADNAIQWVAPTPIDAATDIIPNTEANPVAGAKRATYDVQGLATAFHVPSLKDTPTDYTKYPRIQTALEPNNNALMLIPQNFKAWDVNSGTKAADQNGAYIELSATIVDQAKVNEISLNAAKTAAAKDELRKYVYAGVIGGADTDPATLTSESVFIPVESLQNSVGQWVPGKRINYIVTFGDSNSGSGGGGYDSEGEPILVPIRFRAVVEDWVENDVPLLSATFEATSNSITHKFIDGYTNQLLADVSSASAPKVFKSLIKLNGTTSSVIGVNPDYTTSNANVNFQNLLDGANTYINAKFRPGSVLTYDLTGVSNLDANTNKAKIDIPTGWEGNLGGTKLLAGATATLSAAGNTLVLTKIPTTGYSYTTQVGFIEDNLDAVEANENPLSTVFDNTITVKGTFPATMVGNKFSFSSDVLAKFAAKHDGSKITIDLAVVTFGTKSISTFCPAGWTIQIGGTGTVYYPGDPVALATAGTIVYTKNNSGVSHNYVRASILNPRIAIATDGSSFYWDNVDYEVNINFATNNPFSFTAGGLTSGETIDIYLKYPIKKKTITAGNGFSVPAAFTSDDDFVTYVTYTKP